MIARSTNITCIAVGLLAVTACNPARVATPETASAEAEVVPAVSTVSETAEAPEEQFLVYEWDTEFSAFLSPPIEVRRMAREDCVKPATKSPLSRHWRWKATWRAPPISVAAISSKFFETLSWRYPPSHRRTLFSR